MSNVDLTPETQLNLIVGSAIRALVESGASDESIAVFAHTHRTKVSQVLGLAPMKTPEVSLQEVVTAAVVKALHEAGATTGYAKGAAQNERVYVVVGGQRTSLTLDRNLLQRLSHDFGRKATTAMISSYANQAPSGTTNRSRWVQEQLVAQVALQHIDAGSLPRH